MRYLLSLIFLSCFAINLSSQKFKYIKPVLTDSTKVIKAEINSKTQYERIIYIDYAKNSIAKKQLLKLDEKSKESRFSINETYFGSLKNIKTKLPKIHSELSGKWVPIFRYKNKWILYDDLPKQLLSDTALITIFMDDPKSDVITSFKSEKNCYNLNLEGYNWDNNKSNIKYKLSIKIIDPKLMIAIWETDFQNQKSYELFIHESKVRDLPIMVILESDLMDDQYDIFDKIDLAKLWKSN